MKKKEYEIGDTLCKVTKAEAKTLIETADEREAVQKLIEDMIGQLIQKEREFVTVGKEWWERMKKKYKLPKLDHKAGKSLTFDKETREIYIGKQRI